jgi:hypothetical protein
MHLKKFEILREFEFIFEKALAPYARPRTDVLMKKSEGRKSRITVPLTYRFELHGFDAGD